MVFSSLHFIFIFMPLFFLCYYLVPKHHKNIVLVMGSLGFYFIGTKDHPEYLLLFIIMMLIDYMTGIITSYSLKYKKIIISLGITSHIACLIFFKIAGNQGHIVIPIGISFYTFQGISYIVDVYKNKVNAEKSFLRYVAYISMFEQLIAGPIVTYNQVKNELTSRNIDKTTVFSGFCMFIFGLGLKVLLANPIGKLWTQITVIGFESISTPLAWMGIWAFSFQIYFDFFGYSLMAVGLGKMLGFNLPKNFNHPYTSLTMTDFFRRWHITLGNFFREYVYIPLGGNRNGNIAVIRNLLLVWVLSGLWHGIGYNFLLWGVAVFSVILIEKFILGRFLNKIHSVGHIYMMFLIPVMWAIFAITDKQSLILFFTRLFPFSTQDIWSEFRYDYIKYLKIYYPFFIAGILLSTKLPYAILKKVKNKFVISTFISCIFIACIYCMYQGFDDPFLYFRF